MESACKRMGLELVRGTKKYKWWGSKFATLAEADTRIKEYGLRPQKESDMPAGLSLADRGTCDHVIRIPGDQYAYELGVIRRRDGRPGYVLLGDFEGALLEAVGSGGQKLKQSYATTVAVKQARAQGFRVQEHKLPNGSVQLQFTR